MWECTTVVAMSCVPVGELRRSSDNRKSKCRSSSPIEAYNAAIADLRRHIETIAHAWQDAFDQRSERWQDSNAGIDARTAIEAWDELAEALEDVDLELPDLELPDAN